MDTIPIVMNRLARGLRVNEAAASVGYESPNQFSREFKRYFRASPMSFIPVQA